MILRWGWVLLIQLLLLNTCDCHLMIGWVSEGKLTQLLVSDCQWHQALAIGRSIEVAWGHVVYI